jgi:hypothetical protein
VRGSGVGAVATQITGETQESDELIEEESVIGNSAVLRAFCLGVETQVLEPYRDELAAVEKEFLANKVFTITMLRVRLASHEEVLHDVYQSVLRIVEEKLRGGQLIDAVTARS